MKSTNSSAWQHTPPVAATVPTTLPREATTATQARVDRSVVSHGVHGHPLSVSVEMKSANSSAWQHTPPIAVTVPTTLPREATTATQARAADNLFWHSTQRSFSACLLARKGALTLRSQCSEQLSFSCGPCHPRPLGRVNNGTAAMRGLGNCRGVLSGLVRECRGLVDLMWPYGGAK